MADVVVTNMTADILTAKMPLSDAFNRAIAGTTRSAIHHGLVLSYNHALWPNGGAYSTQYLKISEGNAMVAATETADRAALDPVIISVALTGSGASIDLDDLSIVSTDTEVYAVYLQVAYTQPTVAEISGLVTNAGVQDPKFVIIPMTATAPNNSMGILLGKFCRSTGYVETISDEITPMESGISGEQSLPTAMLNSSTLGAVIKTATNRRFSDLKKTIRFDSLGEDAANSICSTITPLASITPSGAVATSKATVNGWLRPIDWTTTTATIVATNGIYANVSRFEILNTVFTSNAKFSFWRTPGHGKIQEWLLAAEPTKSKLLSAEEVRALMDYGAREFIFDGKGSTFQGNLTIDLVLDFVGRPMDCKFTMKIRNLNVLGNLIINYGPSVPGLRGMAMGTIEQDNVQVLGTINVLRPWPAINFNAVDGDAVSNAWSTAYGLASMQWFLNSGNNVPITGYTGGMPAVITGWRAESVFDEIPFVSRGNILLHYHHNTETAPAATAPAMGNPWLYTGADGAISIRNSTVPTELVPQYGIEPWAATDGIRTKLQNCKYQVPGSPVSGLFYYVAAPSFKPAADGVFTASQFAAGSWKDVSFFRNIAVTDITAEDITTTGNITTTAGKKVIASGNVESSAQVSAQTQVYSAGTIDAQGNLTTNADLIVAGQIRNANAHVIVMVPSITTIQATTTQTTIQDRLFVPALLGAPLSVIPNAWGGPTPFSWPAAALYATGIRCLLAGTYRLTASMVLRFNTLTGNGYSYLTPVFAVVDALPTTGWSATTGTLLIAGNKATFSVYRVGDITTFVFDSIVTIANGQPKYIVPAIRWEQENAYATEISVLPIAESISISRIA